MALTVGVPLGPYEIRSLCGAGGMGEFCKSHDNRLDCTVARQFLPPTVANDPERRVRFEREAKTIAGLNPPTICSLYDVVRQRRHPA